MCEPPTNKFHQWLKFALESYYWSYGIWLHLPRLTNFEELHWFTLYYDVWEKVKYPFSIIISLREWITMFDCLWGWISFVLKAIQNNDVDFVVEEKENKIHTKKSTVFLLTRTHSQHTRQTNKNGTDCQNLKKARKEDYYFKFVFLNPSLNVILWI